jgi:hypothetical protein
MVEQLTLNQRVGGSSPPRLTTFTAKYLKQNQMLVIEFVHQTPNWRHLGTEPCDLLDRTLLRVGNYVHVGTANSAEISGGSRPLEL